MERLSASLYLDEDVDVLVADLLAARGFDALTTRDAGRLRQTDEAQLAFAVAEGRAFLTHNRADFEALATAYVEAAQSHAGIILAGRRSPYEVARRLLVLLNEVTADELRNQVRYVWNREPGVAATNRGAFPKQATPPPDTRSDEGAAKAA